VAWVKGDGNAPPADIVAWFRVPNDGDMVGGPVSPIIFKPLMNTNKH